MADMRSDAILAAKQPFVLSTIANGVATLTLSRPERFNPLSYQMISGIQAELDAIANDPAVRVVILAAEGKGFCAGHDLKEMRAHAEDKGWQQSLFDSCSRMMITLTEIILSRSPAAIRFGKQSFYSQIDRPLGAAYDIASEVMACNMLLEDAAEGIDAFLQKRPASWRGK